MSIEEKINMLEKALFDLEEEVDEMLENYGAYKYRDQSPVWGWWRGVMDNAIERFIEVKNEILP
jgi:hypothetical protein